MTANKSVPRRAIITGLVPIIVLAAAFTITQASCKRGTTVSVAPAEVETPVPATALLPYESETPSTLLPVIPPDKLFTPKTVVWEDEEGSKFIVTQISAIAYGDGKYVAGSDDGAIAYSEDGITWTALPRTALPQDFRNYYRGVGNIEGIAYGNGKFVAGDTFGMMMTSTDGVTWTFVQTPFIGSFGSIAYGNGKFVAVGYTEIYERGAIMYSTDDLKFKDVPLVSGEFGKYSIRAVAYGNGKFVAGNIYGNMAYSADGITWTEVTDNSAWIVNNGREPPYNTANLNSIAYGNNMFVATGNHIKLVTSADGVTWTAVETGIFDMEEDYVIKPAAYYNNMFLIGGYGAKRMAYSKDGVTWTQVPQGAGKN